MVSRESRATLDEQHVAQAAVTQELDRLGLWSFAAISSSASAAAPTKPRSAGNTSRAARPQDVSCSLVEAEMKASERDDGDLRFRMGGLMQIGSVYLQ